MEKNKKNSKKGKSILTYIAIAILIYLLTTMLTAQMKVVSNAEEIIKYKRLEELQDEYVNLKKEYENLKFAYEEQKEVVDEYKTNSSSNSALMSNLTEENKLYSTLAGLNDVQGEGVTVVLDDSKKTPTTGSFDANLYIVHDTDLSNVVNELKAAGAEAISVNGHRIIATSAIRCVGPVISVNGNKIAPPFTIKAIGEAQYLESALNLKNGVVDTMRAMSLEVSVQREKNVVIKKYSDTLKFKHAKPYEGSEE